MKKSLGLNLFSLTTLLFTMIGSAQEALRDTKPEARVGIVEQPMRASDHVASRGSRIAGGALHRAAQARKRGF